VEREDAMYRQAVAGGLTLDFNKAAKGVGTRAPMAKVARLRQ